ncbi:MAG: UDP-N-acetylmuramoyl-L-alanyl-D-glutamate--2,6-diaminopimelate ligase [Oscillospiraceae bacterium]|nr:UDP-N-acetylmuramoyl-L-alanyl-D-glutamate--2,6-diaminopimelate ligase [Oscillospiraceae bacterium]
MLASKLFGKQWLDKFEDTEISGIAYDSRNVSEGNVFVCIKGFETDGHKYAKMAEKNGAAVIVAEEKIDVDVPVWYVENSRITISELACKYYDNPSEKFKLIGVTGTNGKTTITYLIKSILEEAGMRVGVIGTNQNIIGDKVLVTQSTTPTTPNALELQQLFYEMVESDVPGVVKDISLQALALERVRGWNCEGGLCTDLTQDHLDFHKTMERYLAAKAKLFDMCGKGVINFDDNGGKKILNSNPPCDIMTVGIESDSELKAKNINITARGSDFDVEYKGAVYPMHISIPGKFSVYNAICAIGAALQMGIDMKTIQKGLTSSCGVIGRVEVVPTDTDYTVIIDYAHTPDGLENIINAVKEFAKGRVITLFGCGGDRDNTKRAVMGEIAGKNSDYSIITSDNPRTEDPDAIVAQIEEGMKRTDGEYTLIVDRRKAIGYALDFAEKDDVIILAGKGQETYQIIGKEKFDFDERVEVYKHLNK